MMLPFLFVIIHLSLNLQQPLFDMFLHLFEVFNLHIVLVLNLGIFFLPLLSLNHNKKYVD